MGLQRKVSVSSFHYISPCFVTSFNQGCRSFHSFHLLGNRNGFIIERRGILSVSLFHYLT